MKIASQDSRVRLHYSITVEDGTVVETTRPDQPLEFITGRDEIIGALEQNVIGMTQGEKKNFEAGPTNAFGPRDADAVRIVDRNDLADRGEGLEVGMIFRIRDDDGNSLVVTVSHLDEDIVAFDLNHPLAGAIIRFEVEILAVEQVS